MKMMGSRQLLGMEFYSQDEYEVGEVQGFDVDSDTWRIEAIEAKLERDVLEPMKLKKPVFGTQTVRIHVQRISGVAEKVILKDNLDGMQFVPIKS